MESKIKYKIRVKTLENRILTFHNVDSYSNDGGLIIFKDSKTNDVKIFSSANCEIEEER